MADKKISELLELTASGVNVDTDYIPIVDTSDNETKKITPISLLSGRGQKGSLAVEVYSGIITVTLPLIANSATYNIVSSYVMTSVGKVEAVPQIPPLATDSRTTTQFQVEVFDAGTLYWAIY